MANIMITNTSQFKPFSFERYLQPVEKYDEKYRLVEEDYSTLLTQGEAFKQYANQIQNPTSYAKYALFMADLQKASDSFSQGMNASNVDALRKLKLRYATDITPIQLGSVATEASKKNRQEIVAKNPTAIFKNKALTIDDYSNGKLANDEYLIGSDLETRAKLDSALFIQSTIDYNPLKRAFEGNKRIFEFEVGYDAEDLDKVFNSSIADSELSGGLRNLRLIYNNSLSNAGYDHLDSDAQKLVKYYIERGIRQGAGKIKKLETNPNYNRPLASSGNTSNSKIPKTVKLANGKRAFKQNNVWFYYNGMDEKDEPMVEVMPDEDKKKYLGLSSSKNDAQTELNLKLDKLASKLDGKTYEAVIIPKGNNNDETILSPSGSIPTLATPTLISANLDDTEFLEKFKNGIKASAELEGLKVDDVISNLQNLFEIKVGEKNGSTTITLKKKVKPVTEQPVQPLNPEDLSDNDDSHDDTI